MKRLLYLFLVVVILVSCTSQPSDTVPDEQYLIELIQRYDTDINFAQYRFNENEQKPDIDNAEKHYNFEYEIIDVKCTEAPRYQIDVIRRCPEAPSFFTPSYIRFVIDINDKDSFEYVSVMNYVKGEKMQAEDVILNAIKCYDTAVPNTDYPNTIGSDLHFKYLSYAAPDLMRSTYSSTECETYFDYENQHVTIPSKIAEDIIFERFGVYLDRNGISQYDDKNDAYVIPLVIYENFYSLNITEYSCVKDNIYEVYVEKKHQLINNDDESSQIKFVIEVIGDEYRYLSVEYD